MEDDEIAAGEDKSKRELTLEEVFAIIPALPGVETGDFDDLIEEAMNDHADWVVDRMRRGLE